MKNKILLIDDEVNIVKIVKLRLEANGYNVATAFDGEEGLDKVVSEKPDLIIVDIGMPKLGGYEFANKIKQDGATASIPIIVFTANSRMKELFKIEGVKDYVLKPFNEKELLGKISKQFGQETIEVDGKKILIIDDDPQIVKILNLRLKANGYNVLSAENGLVGLDKVNQYNPDLIVLDVMMPEMDGFEFFKTIRKDQKYKKIPIIVLTARGAMKDTFEMFDADSFVPKPFDAAYLVSKIDFLLSVNALVLSKDVKFIEKIKSSLQRKKCNAEDIGSMNELVEKGQESKYQLIIAHLPFVDMEPEKFVNKIKNLKTKDSRILIYCDHMVKGTENNDQILIEKLKRTWLNAKVSAFFDMRIEAVGLSEILAQLLDSQSDFNQGLF